MNRSIVMALISLCGTLAHPAQADDGSKTNLIVEIDPIAAAAAVNESRMNGFVSHQFGLTVDFPANSWLSTGPEFWGATYSARGLGNTESVDSNVRREDLFPGERHRIEAFRLKWNLTKWENPSTLSGRYIQVSYSYSRANSRANRYTEASDSTTNLPTDLSSDTPDAETDLITDTRHGVALRLGNRWCAYGLSWSVGVGIGKDIARKVSVTSSDQNSRKDYETSVNRFVSSRLNLAPVPELSMGIGFAL